MVLCGWTCTPYKLWENLITKGRAQVSADIKIWQRGIFLVHNAVLGNNVTSNYFLSAKEKGGVECVSPPLTASQVGLPLEGYLFSDMPFMMS